MKLQAKKELMVRIKDRQEKLIKDRMEKMRAKR